MNKEMYDKGMATRRRVMGDQHIAKRQQSDDPFTRQQQEFVTAENYPGTKLQIGEWNFGAEHHVSGALAVAEVFGRFAKSGVDSAFYWHAPKQDLPAFQGFLAYRNYDGKGARFRDELVKSESPFGTSIFVSRDPKSNAIVAILLNFEAGQAFDATIEWDGCGNAALKRKFVYSGKGTFAEEKGGGATHVKLPPYSITVLEL